MTDRFTFNSAGQVHELELALDRIGGWNAALVKRMCEGDRLRHIREYLLEQAEITYPEHIIDCDADPFVPDGWKVEEHRKGGAFKWDPLKVSLYLDKGQKNGKGIEGNRLRQALAGKPVLNANVLDYLLANPHLIPEEWKGEAVFFWGTIYRDRDRDGDLYVRCLHWYGGRWHWGAFWLDHDWDDSDPAAVSAS